MSNRKNKSGKNRQKKTQAQANKCNNDLIRNRTTLEGTYQNTQPSYLGGSDEALADTLGDAIDATQSKPKPWYYRVIDWVQGNLAATLIGAAVLAVVGFCFWGVINLQIDTKVINEKIGTLQEDVDDLETTSVSKELLNLQLDSLRESLKAGQSLNRGAIENEIALIKQQIEFIKDELKESEKTQINREIE